MNKSISLQDYYLMIPKGLGKERADIPTGSAAVSSLLSSFLRRQRCLNEHKEHESSDLHGWQLNGVRTLSFFKLFRDASSQ